MRSSVITNAERHMRPVLKWAGGKTQLLEELHYLICRGKSSATCKEHKNRGKHI